MAFGDKNPIHRQHSYESDFVCQRAQQGSNLQPTDSKSDTRKRS